MVTPELWNALSSLLKYERALQDGRAVYGSSPLNLALLDLIVLIVLLTLLIVVYLTYLFYCQF